MLRSTRNSLVTAAVLATIFAPAAAQAGERPGKLQPANHADVRAREQAHSDGEIARKPLGSRGAPSSPKAPAVRPSGSKVESSVRPVTSFTALPGGVGVYESETRTIAIAASADGIALTPLDMGLPRADLALDFTLVSARAGSHVVYDRAAHVAARGRATPAELEGAAGRTVLYRHALGAFEERYIARPDGFEQTFTLNDETGLRAGADLVIEGALATALVANTADRESDTVAIQFNDGPRMAVSYGEVTAIDATGRRIKVPATVDGAALKLTVSGAWLATAAFPVVVDPLLGSMIYVASGVKNETWVDLAYSQTSDQYLVVWQYEYATDDNDIYAVLMNAAGVPTSGVFAIDDSTDDSIRPSCAWSPNGNRFLVAWEDDANSVLGLNGSYDIFGSIVNLGVSPAVYGPVFEVYGSISTHGLARVGAEDSATGNFMVCWTLDYISLGDLDVAAIPVSAGGSPGSLIDVDTETVDSYGANINEFGRGATPFIVAWSDDYFAAGDYDIWARTVQMNGAMGQTFDVAFSPDQEYTPSVAGNGTEWVVAYAADLGLNSTTGQNDWDIQARRCSGTAKLGTTYYAAIDIKPEYEPSVARHEQAGGASPEYLIAYTTQETSPTSIRADRVDATLAVIEDDLVVSTAFSDKNPYVVARKGRTTAEWFVGWERTFSATDTDIRAQRVDETPPPPPTPAFSATPRTGTAPLAVTFSDLSSGGATGWAWDFDNNGTTDSVARNPVFTYTAGGTYSVKLTVTGIGGSASRTETGYITVASLGPVAQFTASPLSGTAPLSVIFADTSTGTPTTWEWDFDNDGTFDSTVRNPGFVYIAAGTYAVKLRVTNTNGTDEELKTAFITVNQPQGGVPPVADFTGTPTSGTAPLTVDFADLSTGTISQWTWSFGDGITASTANSTHIFTTPGVYTVFLAVSGPSGNDTMVRQSYITVTAAGSSGGTSTQPPGGLKAGGGGGGGGGCSAAPGSDPAGALLPALALLLALAALRRGRVG